MIFSDTKDIDDAFTVGKVITVDRSLSPKKVEVNLRKIPYASGQIDETYLLKHTGSMTFPDENNKKYLNLNVEPRMEERYEEFLEMMEFWRSIYPYD